MKIFKLESSERHIRNCHIFPKFNYFGVHQCFPVCCIVTVYRMVQSLRESWIVSIVFISAQENIVAIDTTGVLHREEYFAVTNYPFASRGGATQMNQKRTNFPKWLQNNLFREGKYHYWVLMGNDKNIIFISCEQGLSCRYCIKWMRNVFPYVTDSSKKKQVWHMFCLHLLHRCMWYYLKAMCPNQISCDVSHAFLLNLILHYINVTWSLRRLKTPADRLIPLCHNIGARRLTNTTNVSSLKRVSQTDRVYWSNISVNYYSILSGENIQVWIERATY